MIVDGEAVARFVSEKIGYALCPPYYAVGWQQGDEIVNGVIFCGFEEHDVQATIAGTGWSLQFMRALHSYCFDQLGVLRVTFLTEQEAVIDYAIRLGGKVEGRLRNHFGRGRDGTIIGLLREEALFYKVAVD